ncbi:MAG: hypothetical protein H7318_16450 [Oligoflexus sp.]|nr:hypothetical protein [Oligoflexus sp.]
MKRIQGPLVATLSLLILAGSYACDSAPRHLKFTPGAAASQPDVVVHNDPKASADAKQGVQGSKEELPLELILGAGSQMRFLDGKALTAFYSNIFTKRSYGFEFCNVADLKNLPAEASACTDTIFTAAESPSMGSFDLNNTPQRGSQNVTPPLNLTLNYMKTLRAGLARECNVLVALERANLKVNLAANNKLMKAAAPTAADLDEFFRTILGLKGSGMKVDIGADAYVAAFTQIVTAAAAAADKEKAADQAYLGLCIAIGMNPQVIIY